jgi:hypothetical protein
MLVALGLSLQRVLSHLHGDTEKSWRIRKSGHRVIGSSGHRVIGKPFTTEDTEKHRGRSENNFTAEIAERRSGDLVIGKFKIGNRQPGRWQVPGEPFNMSCGEKLQAVGHQLLDMRWSK